MTTMQEHPADTAAHHAPDLAAEITQLRAAQAELREELVAVRRQRDEAITQAQWLITRVTNAENAIQQLQGEVLLARGTSAGRSVDDGLALMDSTVEIPSQAAASESSAGKVGPWLPPDQAAEGSTAQEFAALTERAQEVEAAEDAEAAQAAAAVPVCASRDVLPGAGAARKGSLLRRRR